jgi:ABC-type uncharacterized transport system auxiliary subunit
MTWMRSGPFEARNLRRVGLWLLGTLAGCATVAPVPQDVFLRLSLPQTIPTSGQPWPGEEIRVAPIAASGLHRERPLVLTEDAGSTLTQSRHRLWIDSPERLLQSFFMDCLRDANVAPRIVAEPGAQTGLVVSGRLLRFEQEVRPGATQVVAGVEFVVRDVRRNDTLLAREFSAEETLADASPTAIAQGMSRAAARICTDLASAAGLALNPVQSRGSAR